MQDRIIRREDIPGRNSAALSRDMDRSYTDRKIEALEDRVERLALACEAMWDLLRRDQNKTDEDLLHWVHHFDASDGHVDGRIVRKPVKCDCGAMISYGARNCNFCGAVIQQVSPFV